MSMEVTDEMIYAFAGEPEITSTDAHAISVGLAAVLEIVKRERDIEIEKLQGAFEVASNSRELWRSRAKAAGWVAPK